MEQDVRREAIDRGEADEDAADRALADQRDRDGIAGGERRERGARLPVERRPRLLGPGRDAEPRRAHRTRRRGQPLDVLRDAPVLGDGAADEDPREHRRRGCDPERCGDRPAVAPAQPVDCERDHVPRAAHQESSSSVCRRRYARDFSRPPQTCIEHQLEERFREAS